MSEASMQADHVLVQIPQAVKRYRIVIEDNALTTGIHHLDAPLEQARKFFIISDDNVFPLYGKTLTDALEARGKTVHHLILPHGEAAKSLANAEKIFEQLLKLHFGRNDALVALGGGVAGDLTGFCAAGYKRGMQWIQIPTTLLAQIDSSIGGKVAVNLAQVKNAVGAFYQPNLVLIDPAVLRSLPQREFNAGLGEVLKYALIEKNCLGAIGTPSFLAWLQTHASAIRQRDTDALRALIRQCCQMKAAVVAEDEQDTTGLRAVLNLGHTFGHALESLSQYAVLHGEAVLFGLLKACQLAEYRRELDGDQVATLLALTHALHLDIPDVPASQHAALVQAMKHDKKNLAADHGLTLILPCHSLGEVRVEPRASAKDVLQFLNDSTPENNPATP